MSVFLYFILHGHPHTHTHFYYLLTTEYLLDVMNALLLGFWIILSPFKDGFALVVYCVEFLNWSFRLALLFAGTNQQ